MMLKKYFQHMLNFPKSNGLERKYHLLFIQILNLLNIK